jgi:hypothetical protein
MEHEWIVLSKLLANWILQYASGGGTTRGLLDLSQK